MSETALTELFASFVPKMIQRRVIEDPRPIDSAVARDFPVVELFADISGFTSLTERLAEKGPLGVESLARILNECFGKLVDIVYEYGCDVVKLAGDALTKLINAGGQPRRRPGHFRWLTRRAGPNCCRDNTYLQMILSVKLIDRERVRFPQDQVAITGRRWQSSSHET